MDIKIKNKILIFGNPLLREDGIPLRILPRLRERFPDIEFKEFDPNEELEAEGRNIRIIDTVQGIKKVTLINDIEAIKSATVYTMHDFDLGYSLKLLKKLHYLDSVVIFGVPMGIRENEAFRQLEAMIIANLP